MTVEALRIRTAIVGLVATALVLLVSAGPAAAHDSTGGSIGVAGDDRRVVVTAPVAFEDLGFTDTSGDGLLDAAFTLGHAVSLGVAASQQVAALAAFNLGVDLAQTAVVLMVIGVLWVGNRVLAERADWIHVAGATAAAGFGVLWTATRLAEPAT